MRSTRKSILAIMLAVMVGVTFVPVFGGVAAAEKSNPVIDPYATSGELLAEGTSEDVAKAKVDATITEEDVLAAGSIDAAVDQALDINTIELEDAAENEEPKAVDPDLDAMIEESLDGGTKQANWPASKEFQEREKGLDKGGLSYEGELTVSLKKSTGKATVTGWVTGGTFYALYVDNELVEYIEGETEFVIPVSMKDFAVGYHEIYATLQDEEGYEDENNIIAYEKAVPTYIYSKPSNKLSYVYAEDKFIKYSAPSFSSKFDYIFVQLKKKGNKKWKTYSAWSSGETGKVSKMTPDKWYYCRTIYAVYDSNYNKVITGCTTGKYSKKTKFRMGKKQKPPVRSVKIKKNGKYYYRQIILYIGGTPYLYRYWYTPVKITVKMKKKPGTRGLFVAGVRKTGNKKLYVVKGSYSGQVKGQKKEVGIYSWQDKKYGGFSPTLVRTAKVR